MNKKKWYCFKCGIFFESPALYEYGEATAVCPSCGMLIGKPIN